VDRYPDDCGPVRCMAIRLISDRYMLVNRMYKLKQISEAYLRTAMLHQYAAAAAIEKASASRDPGIRNIPVRGRLFLHRGPDNGIDNSWAT
jgi:hypothetical protein